MQQENRDMMPLPAHENHEDAGEDASILEFLVYQRAHS
jgi:hypothetical protein